MEEMGNTLKKLILAGIGAAALTAEKSKALLDDMVEKGELTVEQGKALNEELKHTIKKSAKDYSTTQTPNNLDELLDKMSPEDIQLLKEKLNAYHE